jgi:hypothetical protein
MAYRSTPPRNDQRERFGTGGAIDLDASGDIRLAAAVAEPIFARWPAGIARIESDGPRRESHRARCMGHQPRRGRCRGDLLLTSSEAARNASVGGGLSAGLATSASARRAISPSQRHGRWFDRALMSRGASRPIPPCRGLHRRCRCTGARLGTRRRGTGPSSCRSANRRPRQAYRRPDILLMTRQRAVTSSPGTRGRSIRSTRGGASPEDRTPRAERARTERPTLSGQRGRPRSGREATSCRSRGDISLASGINAHGRDGADCRRGNHQRNHLTGGNGTSSPGPVYMGPSRGQAIAITPPRRARSFTSRAGAISAATHAGRQRPGS